VVPIAHACCCCPNNKQFKQNLKHVQKKRWVSARPVPPAAGADAAAAAGGKAGSKRRKKAQAAEANFVFTLTVRGHSQQHSAAVRLSHLHATAWLVSAAGRPPYALTLVCFCCSCVAAAL
jgi:hypothetical protein